MTYVAPYARKSLAENIVVPVLVTDLIQSYYLKKPGGRCMSTLLTFTPEGIVLQGDLTPERNGSVSALGYGLKWFLGELSEGYLCEKFLEKQWVPDLAAEELLDPDSGWLEDLTEPQQAALCTTASWIREGDLDQRAAHDEICKAVGRYVDEMPGYGYVPHQATWLCAIQQRFRVAITPDQLPSYLRPQPQDTQGVTP